MQVCAYYVLVAPSKSFTDLCSRRFLLDPRGVIAIRMSSDKHLALHHKSKPLVIMCIAKRVEHGLKWFKCYIQEWCNEKSLQVHNPILAILLKFYGWLILTMKNKTVTFTYSVLSWSACLVETYRTSYKWNRHHGIPLVWSIATWNVRYQSSDDMDHPNSYNYREVCDLW